MSDYAVATGTFLGAIVLGYLLRMLQCALRRATPHTLDGIKRGARPPYLERV